MVILATLLIPFQVLMVPVSLVLKTLGWVNQLMGIIVPPAATPTGTFTDRHIHDETIYPRNPRRNDRSGSPGWRIRLEDLSAHHTSALRPDVRCTGHYQFHLAMERLPGATNRGKQPR